MAREIVAGDEAGEDVVRVVALHTDAQRTIADEDKAAARIGGTHRGEALEEKRKIFFGRHATGVDDDGIFRGGVPLQPQVAGAAGRVKLPGVDAAREHGEIKEAKFGQLGAEFGGRRKGAGRAIVDTPEPPEDEAVEGSVTVVAGVGVEVGVKARRDGDAQGAGGRHGRGAERALGGDVDDVGTVGQPAAAEFRARRESETKQRIARHGQAGERDFEKLGVGGVTREIGPAGAVDGDRVAASAEFTGDDPKRHRHAVDFRRKSFGDEGDFHEGGAAMGTGRF